MHTTDKPDFTALIAKAWRFYGKQPTGEDVANWFELLAAFPLCEVATAFRRHLTDPQQGHYPPKPADIIRHLNPTDSGHPGPNEAWGMLVRLLRDEGESGVITEEMRAGWMACSPIFQMGDEVGARMCFLETYQTALQRSKAANLAPHWTLTLGHDPERRKQALQAAVSARRISADYARSLLPAPVANLEEVAGLLEHHHPSEPGQMPYRERLRGLIQQANQQPDGEAACVAELERLKAMIDRKNQIRRDVNLRNAA